MSQYPHQSPYQKTNTVHVLMLVFVFILGMFMGFLHERDFDVFITMMIGMISGTIVTGYVILTTTE